MGSFLALKRGRLLVFERRKGELRGGTAVIIRLIGPQDVLQNWMRSLLFRRIFHAVSISPAQEFIDPGERFKKKNANFGFAGNDCTNYGEKSESLLSRLNLTPRTLNQIH